MAYAALFDQILKFICDIRRKTDHFFVRFVKCHTGRKRIDRRIGFAEGQVIIIRKAIHCFLRPVRKCSKHTCEGRRNLKMRFEHALLQKFRRHEAQHGRLAVVKPEAAEQPLQIRFPDRNCYHKQSPLLFYKTIKADAAALLTAAAVLVSSLD